MKTTSWKAALLASAVSAGLAGAANAQSADPETSAVEDVVVTGRRVSTAAVAIGTDQTTNTIAITREALLSAPAGISGLKMLESLPGFNVQANDALGLYEFGNSVTVRAFNFQQVGFVLDGVPMGRSDQFGGSPIFRYVENENLASVTASQGAGDVTLPSYASLGPIVRYDTIDPADDFGVFAGLSAGSDNLRRGFLRVDSGEHGGWSGYASYSDFSADLWRGPGDINREHAEGKLRFQGPNRLEANVGVIWNDYFDYDAPAITRAQYLGTAGDIFGRSGRSFAYLDYVPTPGPVGSTATPTSLPATVAGIPFSNTAYNQYFKQAINSRTDTLIHANVSAPLSDSFRLEAIAYYEDKEGYGVSPEAYATSLTSYNNQRLIVPGLTAPRGLQYGLSTVEGERSGLVGRAVWELGAHTLTGGFWIETDDYRRTQARYNQAGGSPDGEPLLNEPVHLQRDYVSTRETQQLFIQDVISLLDGRLKLELGVKALDIDYEISGFRNPADYINRRQPRITDRWKDRFLPNVGLVWEVTDTEQVFAGFSENLALPRGADDIFSLASPAAPGPQAETSENIEVGIRTNRPSFNAAFAVYRTTFDNRLQSFASPIPGSTTTETFFQNVGGVEAYGAELSGVWKPAEFLYVNANVSYNVSEFQDTFGTFAIAGNRVPDSPEWVIQAGVTVEPFPWLVANLSARHIDDRFTNFTNTETTDSYTLLNAYLDIGEGWTFGPVRDVSLRLNVDNLTDEDYLGTISTTVSTPATFRPGPRRTVQLSLTSSF
jgi:iron complex outermembrane recepter protein